MRKLFTPIRSKRDKLIVILLTIAIMLIYTIRFNISSFWFWKNTGFQVRTITNNTLPLELMWQYTSSEALKVPPLINEQVIVLLSGDNKLTALDILTGNIKWEYTLASSIGLPESQFVYNLDQEYVVITVNDTQLLALDADNGEKIWETDLSSPTYPTPSIMFVGDSIVVGAFATRPFRSGYISSYRLEDGGFIGHIFVSARTFRYLFSCPDALKNGILSAQMVCATLFDRLWIIDLAEEPNVIKEDLVSLYSFDMPYYHAGFIFTNPSPIPAPQVFDTKQNRALELSAGCSRDNPSHPVASYGDLILVSTGCNEVYAIGIHQLEQEPDWLYRSDNDVLSSFVTIDGEIGYVLNDKGEVVGVNLANGEEIGRVTTEPNQLARKKFRNALITDSAHLYTLMDGNTLFVFKQNP